MRPSWRPVLITVVIVGALSLLIRPWSSRPQTVRPTVRTPRQTTPTGPVQPPLTQAVYLFDVSGSMHGGTDTSAFRRAIPLLRRSIQALRNDDALPSPQLHRVGLISSLSFSQRPLCTISILTPGLFLQSDTTASADSVATCESRLRALPPEPATDISGAIKFAALMLQGRSPAARAIILFTDLDQELPQGAAPAQSSLSGICIAVFFHVTARVAPRPAHIDARVAEWTTLFNRWGAWGSYFHLIEAHSGPDLSSFLRDCAARRRT